MTTRLETLVAREVLRDTPRRNVVLMESDAGERFVLKRYRDARGAARERAFLRFGRGRGWRYLHVPRIVEEGDDFVLVEHVARETTNDRAGLERDWARGDVDLWVHALLEFQEAEFPWRAFTWRERIAGALYPAWRTMWLYRRFRTRLPRRLGRVLPALVAAYGIARLRFRGVTTHYDLHGENFAFARSARRMSMLDFELPYARGDPLFDVVYRLVLSATRFSEWTIEAELLRAYVRCAEKRGHAMVGLGARVRLIALQCTLGCMLYHDDRDEVDRHRANLQLLLRGAPLRRWLERVLERPVR